MKKLLNSVREAKISERIHSLKKEGYDIIYVSLSGRIGYARKDKGYCNEIIR